jgi:hypothetical protein
MVILDLWGISFHSAVVVGLGNDLLFNSILAHCDNVFHAYLMSGLKKYAKKKFHGGFFFNPLYPF